MFEFDANTAGKQVFSEILSREEVTTMVVYVDENRGGNPWPIPPGGR